MWGFINVRYKNVQNSGGNQNVDVGLSGSDDDQEIHWTFTMHQVLCQVLCTYLVSQSTLQSRYNYGLSKKMTDNEIET